MISTNPSLGSLFRAQPANAEAVQARNDRYRTAATQATQVPNLLSAAEHALKGLGEASFAPGQVPLTAATGDRPMLTAPKAPISQDAAQAQDTFTRLMAELVMMLGEAQVSGLKNRLELLRAMAASATQGYNQRSEEYMAAVAQLEAATAAASTTEAQLNAARERVDAAQSRLDSAEAALAGLDPESPEYAAAVQARDQARGQLQQATTQLQSAQTAHGIAMRSAESAAVLVQRLGDALQSGTAGSLPKALEDGMKRELDAGSKLSLLMLQFAELMGDSQETKLELDQALFREMQAARQAYMERKSDEYLAAVEKAEKAKKAAGCIGILVAAVMTVVSVVLTVASGGILAGVAVGLIGVALLSLQALNMAGVTDFDPLAPIMDPIMKGVMFLAEQWTKVIKFALQQLDKLGVLDALKLPDNFIDIASSVIGTVQVMAALVLAAIFAGPAAGSMAKQLMAKMTEVLTKIIDKIVERLLAKILEKINEKILSSTVIQQIKAVISKIIEKMTDINGMFADALGGAKGQSMMANLQMSAVVVETAGTGASAGFNAASGVYRFKAAESLAEVQLVQAISEQLKNTLSASVEAFIDQSASTTRFINQFLQSQEQHFASAQFVATRKI